MSFVDTSLRRPAILLSLGCLLILGCDSGSSTNAPDQQVPDSLTARQIVKRVQDVYRNAATYADNAIYQERYVLADEGVPREGPPHLVSVVFKRPDKIRITRRVPDAKGDVAAEYLVVGDGKRMYSALPQFPRQVLEEVLPIELNAENVITDEQVRQHLFWLPPSDSFAQLMLLFGSSTHDAVFAEDAELQLLKEDQLGGSSCHRIAVDGDAGRHIFWIDQESYVLRRIDLPTRKIREQIDPDGRLRDQQIWIEFRDATVGKPIPDEAFAVDLPSEAVVVKEWMPGHPGPPPEAESPPAQQEAYAQAIKQYNAALEGMAEGGSAAFEVTVPQAEIAAATEPAQFQRDELWSVDLTASDVVPVGKGESSRLVAVVSPRTIVELSPEGEELTRRELQLEEDQGVVTIRGPVDAAEGSRFAVFAPGGKQVLILNEDWETTATYPTWSHPGISDVRFVPATEGEPTIAVAFWGDIGLHGLSLDAERQWVDRSYPQILNLAVQTAEKSAPILWLTHHKGSIARLTPDGPLPEIQVAQKQLVAVSFPSDSSEESPQQLTACGLAFLELGSYQAIGFHEDGRETWQHDLPKGEFTYPIRRIVPARLPGFVGWMLPGADGSIRFISTEGEEFDQFNHGSAIRGLATMQAGTDTVLVIADENKLTAWQVTAASNGD